VLTACGDATGGGSAAAGAGEATASTSPHSNQPAIALLNLRMKNGS
jgi:hypothetical protein